ncbi:hypothetical protein Nepgr_022748 [Nepenthes gracilis]|uniref:Transmembrane protein n=1 Tax=Nepenthes gracilis TaxID=150966 RepID=A0AAD3T1E6_NEPGR|nr:hypothetical protein Nepgr_022748 [Nepenthes gracilis]
MEERLLASLLLYRTYNRYLIIIIFLLIGSYSSTLFALKGGLRPPSLSLSLSLSTSALSPICFIAPSPSFFLPLALPLLVLPLAAVYQFHGFHFP